MYSESLTIKNRSSLRSALLRFTNHSPKTPVILIFIFSIPKTTSTSLSNNSSIFSTYNSSSAVTFTSSAKSRIPCFVTNVGSNNKNSNPLYWKAKTLSIDRFSEVSCLIDEKQPIPGIPDLILNGITYSSIDFQSSLDHKSSVGFAIDKFIFELEQKVAFERSSAHGEIDEGGALGEQEEGITEAEKRQQTTRDEVLLLTTYWKIYGAMDIALRVLDNNASARILTLSKGPGFVLNFQRARLEGKVKEIESYLGQILRNCFNCTGIEATRLILLARASGLMTNETLSQAEEHLTSGSSESQWARDGRWYTRAYGFLSSISLFALLFVHT